MIGRRCASCFSHDEGMPRTRVSFRICAKKAFFTSLFVGREGRARTRWSARRFCVSNARNALFACRVWTRNVSGYSVTRNAQSREIKCRTRESAACEIENRYDVPVAKSRFPFLESQTVVFLGRFSRCLWCYKQYTQVLLRVCFGVGDRRGAPHSTRRTLTRVAGTFTLANVPRTSRS